MKRAAEAGHYYEHRQVLAVNQRQRIFIRHEPIAPQINRAVASVVDDPLALIDVVQQVDLCRCRRSTAVYHYGSESCRQKRPKTERCRGKVEIVARIAYQDSAP